jgi:hypothetical protein
LTLAKIAPPISTAIQRLGSLPAAVLAFMTMVKKLTR